MNSAGLVIFTFNVETLVQSKFFPLRIFDTYVPRMEDSQNLIESLERVGFFMKYKLVLGVIELEKFSSYFESRQNGHFVGEGLINNHEVFVIVKQTDHKVFNLGTTIRISEWKHHLNISSYFGELPKSLQTDIQKTIQVSVFVLSPEFLN
jgi:hypothetical protein